MKIIKKIIICIIPVIISVNAYSQNKINKIISEIREKYKEIVSDKESYYMNSYNNGDKGDTGGVYILSNESTSSYYKTKKLEVSKQSSSKYVRNKVVSLDDDSESTEELIYIYYDNNKPIFQVENTLLEGHPDYYSIKKTYFQDSIPFYSKTYENEDNDTVPFTRNEINNENESSGNSSNLSSDYIKIINEIYDICKNITDNKKSYLKETVEYSYNYCSEKNLDYEEEKSDLNEKVIYYGDIRLIVKDYSGETNINYQEHKNKIEYYFSEGELFFCFIKGYDKIMDESYLEDIKITAYEKRIYIHDKTPIRILEKKINKKTQENNWGESEIDRINGTIRKMKNSSMEIKESNYKEISEYLN